MRNNKQAKGKTFVRRFPRLLATGILLAMAVLSIGVVAGISKQRSRAQQSARTERIKPSANAARANLLKAQKVDAQTGLIRPLTQEEAQELAAALKELANQSTEGLKSEQHSNGSVSMDLQGRFQNVALAKRNEDGTLSQACIDNPESGAAFFGIDPNLVGVQRKTGSTASSASSGSK